MKWESYNEGRSIRFFGSANEFPEAIEKTYGFQEFEGNQWTCIGSAAFCHGTEGITGSGKAQIQQHGDLVSVSLATDNWDCFPENLRILFGAKSDNGVKWLLDMPLN